MNAPTHPSTLPLTDLVLRVKPGITWSLHESGGRQFYLIEDSVQSRFLRMGLREQAYLARMDGRRTVSEIATGLSATDGHEPLNEDELRILCQWLLQADLVESPQLPPRSQSAQAAGHHLGHQLLTNPLFLKIPLFCPDRLLDRAFPWLRWTLTRPAALVWGIVVAWASISLWGAREEFSRHLTMVFDRHNWFWLLVSWLGLKAVHELYHGLVCKLYGGKVSQAGLMFILFSPVAYVDVTSSWKFRSKWHRIYTAAAGMYVEFFIAALAALAWCRLDDGWLRQLCHNLVTTASVATVVFNGNFLMRFDGYYIFSDLLELQNLYGSARQSVMNQLRSLFLGQPSLPLPLDRGRWWIVTLYGWASLAWRVMFTVGILIVSARMFRGLGIVLAAITAIGWFAVPAVQWWRRRRLMSSPQPVRWWRFVAVTGALATVLAAVAQLPWPGGVSAPAVVSYAPLHVVRIESPGFVDEVCVTAGQEVTEGEILVRLRNPETVQRLEDLRLEIAQSEVYSRILHREQLTSEYLVENRRREALRQQLAQLEADHERLTVRAAANGRVIGHDLEALVGQYVMVGQELMAIGDERRKQVEASVAAHDVDSFQAAVGESTEVFVRGAGRLAVGGQLSRLNPRASTLIPHPALIATFGGPLAVTVRQESSGTGSHGQTSQLAEPRSTAIVDLPAEVAAELRAGQVAQITLAQSSGTVGQHVARHVRGWLHKKSAQGEARTGGL
ncbi:MAG: efflux RND transporter periplasmic adaptor subunit [Pirellulales bacterium]